MIKLINRGRYDTPILEEFEHLTTRLSAFLSQIFDVDGNQIREDELPREPVWTDVATSPGFFGADAPMTITVTNVVTYGYLLDGPLMIFFFHFFYTLGGTAARTIYFKLPVGYRVLRTTAAEVRISFGTTPVVGVVTAARDADHLAMIRMDLVNMTLGANDVNGQIAIPVYQVTP